MGLVVSSPLRSSPGVTPGHSASPPAGRAPLTSRQGPQPPASGVTHLPPASAATIRAALSDLVDPTQTMGDPRRDFLRPPAGQFVHLISGVGFVTAAEVNHDPRSTIPPEPRVQEPWEIGFIQNIIQTEVVAHYDGRQPVSFRPGSAWLDAERPGRQAWWTVSDQPVPGQDGTIRGFASFVYGGGQGPSGLLLGMSDFPAARFFNVFGGGGRGHQLLDATQTTRFQIWIAAKRRSDPPDQRASYHALQTARFTLTTRIAIQMEGNVPFLAPGNSPPPARLTVQPHGAHIDFDQLYSPPHIVWERTTEPPRVVSGPAANAELNRLLARAGVG